MSSPRQHTPGPWSAYSDPLSSNPSLTWGINGFHPVTGFHSPQDCQLATVYDVEANARLIASAPELLAACLSALRALEDNLSPGPMDEDAKAGLRAAIARATGGAA